MKKVYYLMNKDSVVLEFIGNKKNDFSDDIYFTEVNRKGKIPFGFSSINSWIEGRKASKHNAHLRSIMKKLGCNDNEGFIRITHATSVNDTFWIKSENENISWNDVSLYSNQFTEAISKLAFEGVGLYEEVFSSTSPELSCDGSFRKCFKKEEKKGEFGSNIFLYKRGHELGAGLEPYCEALASEIAGIIAPENYVKYEICYLHDRLASKCNIFTDEINGYASFAKINPSARYSLQDIFEYFEKIGSEEVFREMLVVDSLCFNQDRHAGNYGVIFDNNTMEVKGMSPIFDLNLSMLPYVEMEEFEHIGDKLFEYAPKLGDDFTRIGQMGMNDVIRERVKNIVDFSFTFRGDEKFSSERVQKLEDVIRKQAKAILSKEKLQTSDVFYSNNAKVYENQQMKVEEASASMEEFLTKIDEEKLSEGSFLSVCNGSDTVQLYLENESYMLTIDFLNNSFIVKQNTIDVTEEELKNNAPDFYKDVKYIEEIYNKFCEGKV
ncbi:MAG: hypothetical protein K6G26_03350 [Lachnospiraceae bacterium]|nr:hypothetical protein [Lachnospiraceae bacterium]